MADTPNTLAQTGSYISYVFSSNLSRVTDFSGLGYLRDSNIKVEHHDLFLPNNCKVTEPYHHPTSSEPK